jgi:hypothetical protein
MTTKMTTSEIIHKKALAKALFIPSTYREDKDAFYRDRGLMTPQESFDFGQACEDMGYDN